MLLFLGGWASKLGGIKFWGHWFQWIHVTNELKYFFPGVDNNEMDKPVAEISISPVSPLHMGNCEASICEATCLPPPTPECWLFRFFSFCLLNLHPLIYRLCPHFRSYCSFLHSFFVTVLSTICSPHQNIFAYNIVKMESGRFKVFFCFIMYCNEWIFLSESWVFW